MTDVKTNDRGYATEIRTGFIDSLFGTTVSETDNGYEVDSWFSHASYPREPSGSYFESDSDEE